MSSQQEDETHARGIGKYGHYWPLLLYYYSIVYIYITMPTDWLTDSINSGSSCMARPPSCPLRSKDFERKRGKRCQLLTFAFFLSLDRTKKALLKHWLHYLCSYLGSLTPHQSLGDWGWEFSKVWENVQCRRPEGRIESTDSCNVGYGSVVWSM
jgi:hypothetical protein